jgi:hypothetical protein
MWGITPRRRPVQFPYLARLARGQGGAQFVGVHTVQVVMGSGPRIAPAFESAAQGFAAQVPVLLLCDGDGASLGAVQRVDQATAPLFGETGTAV